MLAKFKLHINRVCARALITYVRAITESACALCLVLECAPRPGASYEPSQTKAFAGFHEISVEAVLNYIFCSYPC